MATVSSGILKESNFANLKPIESKEVRQEVYDLLISGEEPVYHELVNPEIVERSGEQIGPEGCLSLPNIWGIVTRPEKVTVKAQDRYGEPFTLEAEELLARACCHEIDHLNGVLFDELADRFLSEEEIREMTEGEAE